MEKRPVRIGEASVLTGFSARQLRYFDKLGITPMRYVGSHRAYSQDDLDSLRELKKLERRGLKPQQISTLLRVAPWSIKASTPTEFYRAILERAKAGTVVSLGEKGELYHTTYRGLQRLAAEMNWRVETQKRGSNLFVQAWPGRAERPNALGKGRRTRKKG